MKKVPDADRTNGGSVQPSREGFAELPEDEFPDEYGNDNEDDADDYIDHTNASTSAVVQQPAPTSGGVANGGTAGAADQEATAYEVPAYEVPEVAPPQLIETYDQESTERIDDSVPIAGKPASPAPAAPPQRSSRFKRSSRKLIWGVIAVVVALIGAKYVLGSAGQNAAHVTPAAPQAPSPAATPPQSASISGIAGPIVLMNPGMAKPGDQIAVSGYSFVPQGIVDLYFKQQATGPSQAIGYVRTDQTGSFSSAFQLPHDSVAGPFVLEARQRNGKQVADANGSVTAGVAFVKMGTVVGKVGDFIGWSGSGFAPGETINVYWNALGTQPLATFHANSGGTIKATIQVPFSTVGWNSLIFMGVRSQSPITTSFLVLRLYPTIKPSSYALKADNPISFSGSGFGPNERVLIFLNSMNGPPMAIAQADTHGAFNNAGTIMIPFTFKGKQTLLFVGEESRQPVSITFSVLPYMPHAQASTYGGLPGTTISFYAFDFAQNEVVHVYTGRGQGSAGTMVACFMTDGKGAAGAQGSYTIPGDAQGKLTFSLVGASSGATTTAVVSVMPSSVPVQVPAQSPFTCPLDNGNRTSPQAPNAAGAAGAGGVAPGSQAPQTPQTQPQVPAGGAGNGAQGAQPQTPAAVNPTAPPTQAPADQQLPQTAPGAATPGTQAPAGTPGQPGQGNNTNNTNAQGSLDSSANPPELALVATALTVPMTHQTGIDHAHSMPASPGHASPAGRTRPAEGVQKDWSSRPIMIVGLLWFVLVVILLLTTIIRACGSAPKDNGIDIFDDDRAGPLGTRLAKAHLPWRHHSRRSAGQVVPVVAPSGARLSVPEVAGMSLPSRPNRQRSPEFDVLAQVGPPAGCIDQQPYALLVVTSDIGRWSSNGCVSEGVTQSIGQYIARGMESARPLSPTGLLMGALANVHAELCARNERRPSHQGVTITAALLVGSLAHIVSIGPSRVYVLNPITGLRQVTTDHSIVAALVANKLLAPEALYTHPRRDLMYRCLGLDAQSRVDAFEIPLECDDRLVLCTDQFWQAVRDPSIDAILRATPDLQRAARRLLSAALEGGERRCLGIVIARPLGSIPRPDMPSVTTRPALRRELLDFHGIGS